MKNLFLFFILFFALAAFSYPQRTGDRDRVKQRPIEEKVVPPIKEEVITPIRDVNQIVDRERPTGHPERPIVHEEPLQPQRPQRPANEEKPRPPHRNPPVEQPVYNEPPIIVDEYNDLPDYDCHCIQLPYNENDIEIIETVSLKIQGIEKFENKEYQAALQILWDALIEDPDDPDLYFYRGCTNVKLANYGWAIEDLDIYLHEWQKDYVVTDSLKYKKAYYYRGLARYYDKDKERAFADFETSAGMGDLEAQIFIKRFY